MELNPSCANTLARIKLLKEQADAIVELWETVSPAEPPSQFIITGWLKQFDYATVEKALEALAVQCQKIDQKKLEGKGVDDMTTAACVRYASAVMWSTSGKDAGRPLTARRIKNQMVTKSRKELPDEVKEAFGEMTGEEHQKLIAREKAAKRKPQ